LWDAYYPTVLMKIGESVNFFFRKKLKILSSFPHFLRLYSLILKPIIMPPKKSTKTTLKVKNTEPEVESESEQHMDDVSTQEDITHDETAHEDNNSTEDLLDTIDQQIASFMEMRTELTNQIQALRKVRKGVAAMTKKLIKKKKTKNSNKKPSGINMAFPIDDVSPILATFMKEHHQKEEPLESFSRINALTTINKYIKEHKLQDPKKKTQIKMDGQLKKLFPNLVTQKKALLYTGIMASLGQHFPKKAT